MRGGRCRWPYRFHGVLQDGGELGEHLVPGLEQPLTGGSGELFDPPPPLQGEGCMRLTGQRGSDRLPKQVGLPSSACRRRHRGTDGGEHPPAPGFGNGARKPEAERLRRAPLLLLPPLSGASESRCGRRCCKRFSRSRLSRKQRGLREELHRRALWCNANGH